MEIKEAREFINNQKWIYAKTYAKTFPHEYIVKNENNKKEFEEFLKLMRKEGKPKKFYNYKLLYFELDGKKYWEFGRPTKVAIIINRDDIGNFKLEELPLSEKENLLRKIKQNDKRIEQLSQKNLTNEEKKELKTLLSTKRKSNNRIIS